MNKVYKYRLGKGVLWSSALYIGLFIGLKRLVHNKLMAHLG